jgi:hypothetical protein
VTVLRFKERFELPATDRRRTIDSQPENSDALEPMHFEWISDHELVVGYGPAVSKLANLEQPNLQFARQVSSAADQQGIAAVVSIAPIRGILRSFAGLVARFNDSAKELNELPTELQFVTMKLDLNRPQQFLQVLAQIGDADLRTTIAKMLRESSNKQSAVPIENILAMTRGQAKDLMFQPRSLEAILACVKEISEKQLWEIANQDDAVSLTIARPAQFPDMLAAIIGDATNFSELNRRINNMKSIADALKTYYQKHGSLPSGFPNRGGGKPDQLSWRVAILPMLGHQELYDRFDFDQSWDSPANLEVASEIPNQFRVAPNSIKSSYQIVQGPGRIYDAEPFPKVPAGSDNEASLKAIVVEVKSDNAYEWTRPNGPGVELPITDIGRDGENGILMITTDFRVRILKRSADKLNSILTIASDESISRSDFIALEPPQ